jgi:hypothetical protein
MKAAALVSPVGRLSGPLLVTGPSCGSMGGGGCLFAALARAAWKSVLLAKTESPRCDAGPRGGPFGALMGVRRRRCDKISVLMSESASCVTAHQRM